MKKIISIPKELSKKGELVVIPKSDYEELLRSQKVTSDDVLRWTRHARFLLKKKKLPELKF
ncbi:MAG: hypothetical protein A2402_01890 [Candidatus Staskawiczbacteria bacterium RIFOXYC1_FULL_37_43]|uniref:Uncharacterized protein n=1 Tax=Candidatus Nomurabacteria bacterium RIFOXYA1_FULL_35_17 TaxID=1801798 RepID=A0A1F6YHL4_9BACT|nr:MAG: hypothetical protein A2192_01375 [Candidatus Nomurabacteria bacterium RIFOXYA1_FULL_35_17]OGZ63519.1 MAG: hypothetical protein A2813_00245 [Candidatus Staskawiczbacteria bacterium RIFCSPHIGHO2_01_FULL_37_17]OGZ71379.1 MAG: hypothetical protein A2891_02230 [Candidatus Staskawiczbacteria bacterium RIFCSPLOWO2_01_FULL_37_19]OGZ77015.1 MAG: hypothetical protein A2280_01780 [Candidatus Staskawiczbacteria bacterium RIFOXYA12_FULL_37_10]OGZ80772.1 MAG: hypothetical protein A2353_00840 [Candida